jgi:transposase
VPGGRVAGAAAKKKTLHDSQRDTPKVQHARQVFEAIQETYLMPLYERLRFLDEFGLHQGLTRVYGRAAPGVRIHEGTPGYSGPHYTVVATLGIDGVEAPWLLEGALDRAAFLAYAGQVLVPTLQAGDVVLMDNLSAHKCAEVEAMVRAVRAYVIYLPTYSPDLNPIEKCWAKVKASLRKSKARTYPALLEALREALLSVKAEDAYGWFDHAGYVPV